MGEIKWTKKLKQYRDVDVKNCFVQIYVRGSNSKEGQDLVAVFKFIEGCHKKITRTKALTIGYSKEENRIYFVESLPDEGYTINEFNNEAQNAFMQIRKSTSPELYEVVKQHEGKYNIQKGFIGADRIYYLQLGNKAEQAMPTEQITEKDNDNNDEILKEILSEIKTTNQLLREMTNNSKFQFDMIKNINSNTNTAKESLKQIFTEVKYKLS